MINTHLPITGGVFQQAASGLKTSSEAIVESANELVRTGTIERASTTTTDIVEPLIEMRQQQQVFDASATVVEIADEALGALIDTSA